MVLLADVLSDGAGHHDGNCVIGGGYIHRGHQSGDAQLGTPLGVGAAVDEVDEPLDAAIFPHQGADTGHDDGDDSDVIHSGDARPHHREDLGPGKGAGGHAHDQAQHSADGQDQEHVDAGHGPHQDHQIGQDLPDAVCADLRLSAAAPGEGDEDHQGEDGCRQDDEEVHAELVLHLTALGADRGDGGVGDHGEVVTEHGARGHRRDAQDHLEAGGFAHGDGEGGQGGDGAHRGAHGDGHEAGDQEQARHRELAGQVVQEQIDRAVGAAGGLDRAGKGACGQKDQAHGEDVLIRHPVGHYLQLGVEVQGPVLDAGYEQGDEEGHDGRGLIEAHLDLEPILEQQAAAQIEDQEHQDGEQGGGIAPLLRRIEFSHRKGPPFSFSFDLSILEELGEGVNRKGGGIGWNSLCMDRGGSHGTEAESGVPDRE